MAELVPNGYAKCRWVFECDGVADEMSFGCGVFPEVGGDAGDIAAIANSAIEISGLVDELTILQGWRYTGTRVALTVSGEPVVGEDHTTVAGELTGESLLVNTALLVRKNTAFGGRRNRGRFFAPPFCINESAVANSGVIETATHGPLATMFNVLHSELLSGELTPTLFHSHPDDLPTPILSFALQNLVATQRRRMR